MRRPILYVQAIKYLSWIVLILAIVYFVSAWMWMSDFIWGNSAAPYWLFVVIARTVLPLAAISFVACLGIAAVWLARHVRQEPATRSETLSGGIFVFLTGGVTCSLISARLGIWLA